MPSWKINCLKSEDGPHPSISTDETNKIESTSLLTDLQCTDNPIAVSTIGIHSLPSSPSVINRREQKQRYYHHTSIS
ncbi:unnamed protein product [Rotaria magnacalcarata]|nr:unnamed protein product [Rotaria magnacalcarata]CAF3773351.1 unnamed protein product [Rotaria magnacalcarata]